MKKIFRFMSILLFASFALITFNSCEEIGNEIEKTPEELIVGYWLDEGDVFDAEYYFSSIGEGYMYITRGWDIELIHFKNTVMYIQLLPIIKVFLVTFPHFWKKSIGKMAMKML